MARGGLVLVCGLMAQYQDMGQGQDKNLLPDVLRAVMFKGLRIQGFSQVGQDALRPAFEKELAVLLAGGQIKPKVHVEEGIERLPGALVNLFNKSTTGKVVVHIAQNFPSAEKH
jgi:NADPH-dependent curcumin reductase